MFSNIFFFLLLFKFINCEKSLTVVIDTTKSMRDDLDIIKANLPSVIYGSDEGQYILVPFNEDVGEPIITTNPRDFITAINRLQASGGHTCPENSLAGIERALQISKPLSKIFVFTDAYAKDVYKLASIENLCRESQNQIYIFLSNFCSSPTVTAQVYYDVTQACSGMLFRLDINSLRQIFKYLKEIIKVEWTDVTPYVISEDKDLSFTVDAFTKTVLIAASGEFSIIISSPKINSTSTLETIVASRNTQVIRLVEASPDTYTVAVRCQGITSVVFYKKSELPLRIGFSTEQPRCIKETSRRPLPGKINYLLIEVFGTTKLESISMQVFNDPVKKTLQLQEISNTSLYLTKTYIEADKSFRLWFHGYDTITYQKITGSTESLIPQVTVIDPRSMQPKVEIIEEGPITIEWGKPAKVACKAAAYPKPTVWWEDENNNTLSTSDGVVLEIPYVYINYAIIDNTTTNLTLFCRSKNSIGEDSKSIDVYVHRPYMFEVLQKPKDQAIEYGEEGILYCQVSAYPEAVTKWYHNDSLVVPSEDFEISNDSTLSIKRMTLDTVGEYMCELSNIEETKKYTAQVTISGLESPQVEIENSDVVLKIGDWTSVECTILKGKPLPVLSWKFKPRNQVDFVSLPESVAVEDSKLKIGSAQIENNGIFRCSAENIEGQHYADVNVTVQQPPTIADSETRTVVVKEDEDVQLTCDVTASPEARVHWEMSQDDVIIQFDNQHHTDDHYTHRFKALAKDSGNYHCIAENVIGTAKKTVIVNVLVKPFIEAPQSKIIRVRAGFNVSLTCNVLFGNPVPSTKWEFTALDSTVRTLKRGNSSSVLNLSDVRHADEGTYMCIADNDIGRDSISINLKVL